MINTSNEYKQRITEDRRFSMKATITFEDGSFVDIDDSKIYQGGMSFDDATSGRDEFQLGSAIIGKHTLMLDNSEGTFDTYEFAGATVVPYVGLELSETTEYLKKGVYTVDEYTFNGNIINLECLDNMHFFEKPFTDININYPISTGELLDTVASFCGVTINTTDFTNSDFLIQNNPEGTALSCLDIVAYIAQLSGNFAKINTNGALELKWYDLKAFEPSDVLDGGIFDKDKPYSTGDDADGGDFTFSETEYYDGGNFEQTGKYHHFHFLSNSPTVAMDDIVITGVQVEDTMTYEGEYSILYGSQGYVLSIVNNPLIQSESDATVIANSVGAKIVGMRFRPFSANILSDPSIEVGDPCYLSVRTNRGYNTYQSFITIMSYTVAQNQNVECSAETVSRKNSTIYSTQTKTIMEARNLVKDEQTARKKAISELNQIITNSSGLFGTEETLADGSKIYYLHDRPSIGESQIIWRMSADVFAVSNDGGQTYETGLTADGDAIVRRLRAVGINADWVDIGGSANGVLRVKDDNNNTIVLIDNQGITLNNGAKLIGNGGVLSVFQYVSVGTGLGYADPAQGWAHCGLGGIRSEGFDTKTVGVRTFVPANFTITNAQIQVGHMPIYAEYLPLTGYDTVRRWKQARNLKLYSGASNLGAGYYSEGTSLYGVEWRSTDDITSSVFGTSTWSPYLAYSGSNASNTSNIIQYKTGDISNHLTPGEIQTFYIETTDTPNFSNYENNECLMQIVVTVEGYKY